jgi:hypothetical protein
MTAPNYGPKEAINDLVKIHGPEKVKAAAEALLGESARTIPAEHFRVIAPAILADTVTQLDASVDDLLRLGEAREAAYENKAELLREKYLLENKIQLEESQAIMEGLAPDGKTVEWNGIKYPFSNDLTRDAFRRTVSSETRKRLAEVEGELAALEVQASIARDAWEKAVHASESIRSKAYMQARLLQFLAGGQ